MTNGFVIKYNVKGNFKERNFKTSDMYQAISIAEACLLDWVFIKNKKTGEIKTRKEYLKKALLVK